MKPNKNKILTNYVSSVDMIDYEKRTTQHNTGIFDYYMVIFDSEEKGLYCKSAEWIAKILEVKPTGIFRIVHMIWNDELDKEEFGTIDISPKEMKKLFKWNDISEIPSLMKKLFKDESEMLYGFCDGTGMVARVL
jgi:hypothetical protein